MTTEKRTDGLASFLNEFDMSLSERLAGLHEEVARLHANPDSSLSAVEERELRDATHLLFVGWSYAIAEQRTLDDQSLIPLLQKLAVSVQRWRSKAQCVAILFDTMSMVEARGEPQVFKTLKEELHSSEDAHSETRQLVDAYESQFGAIELESETMGEVPMGEGESIGCRSASVFIHQAAFSTVGRGAGTRC